MGLKEKCLMYMVPSNINITNFNDLKDALNKISIKEYKYNLNKSYNGYNSIEYQLQKICLTNEELRQEKFTKLIKKFKNLGIDVEKIEDILLDDNTQNIILTYILNNYGEDFYKFDSTKQRAIIICMCEYIFDNHSVISNWILHFMYVIGSDEINKNYFIGDDLVNFASVASLQLIKAYHLLYRLQYEGFQEIDYNLINFQFDKDDYFTFIEDKNGYLKSTFVDSFNKLKMERPDLNNVEIKNKIICDIIRDSLAHGNIKTFFNVKNDGSLEHIIEFDDIYRNKNRGIQMTMGKFKDFLNSEAFLPKYALYKEEPIILNK